jgi:hypothetical protein
VAGVRRGDAPVTTPRLVATALSLGLAVGALGPSLPVTRAAAPDPLPHPHGYVAPRAAAPPVIDGRLDDPAWTVAPWTAAFVDIADVIGGPSRPAPALGTRARMIWDDRAFYVAADLAEPHLWSTITAHDAVIFRDHDFEVFVDPDGDTHQYYEFEINARGAFWDLFLPLPYRAGGKAIDSYEMPGLQSAVRLDGTLNDPRDTDRGWTVEVAFPWAAFGPDQRAPAVPKPGDQWRVNFSRVEWTLDVVDGRYLKRPGVPEHNWVWSPQGVVDMHRPERWGYVQFAASAADPFVPDAAWPARQWLQAVCEAQRAYRDAHGEYAALDALGVPAPADVDATLSRGIVTRTHASLFEATVDSRAGGRTATWHIRQDGRVWRGGSPVS